MGKRIENPNVRARTEILPMSMCFGGNVSKSVCLGLSLYFGRNVLDISVFGGNGPGLLGAGCLRGRAGQGWHG